MTKLFGLLFLSEKNLLSVANHIFSAFGGGKKGIVITANPEILLRAWRNPEYHNILSKALIRTIDGTGLALVGSLIVRKHLYRAHGSDLLPVIINRAEKEQIPVHFILKPKGLIAAHLLENELPKRWPGLSFSISQDTDTVPEKAKIIFANHGAPKQEFILDLLIKKQKNFCLGIGIGAACDFLVGTQTRAPEWMRKIGLEWLYRLIRQPWRIKRIINAVVVFPIVALFHVSD